MCQSGYISGIAELVPLNCTEKFNEMIKLNDFIAFQMCGLAEIVSLNCP